MNRELQKKTKAPSKDSNDDDSDSGDFKYPPPPPGVTCWICFDDEQGDLGPLVRDCSCRNESGYCHLLCIENWAKQKSQINDTTSNCYIEKFTRLWKQCPNCCQPYQNQLAVDMASTFISFVESKKYPIPPHYEENFFFWVLAEAHNVKLIALRQTPGIFGKHEGEIALKHARMIISITQLRFGAGAPERILYLEAVAYDCIGCFTATKSTKENLSEAVKYYEKSRDLFKQIGLTSNVRQEADKVFNTKAVLQGDDVSAGQTVRNIEYMYEHAVKSHGEEHPVTISTGIKLAEFLKRSQRWLEADRLLMKLFAISRRVHGTDHQVFKEAEAKFKDYRRRCVILKSTIDGKYHIVQLLRYEDSEYNKCVVRFGGLEMGSEEGPTVIVDAKYVGFSPATPIICHGLKQLRFNDKIGIIKEKDEKSGRYKVEFEDKNLKPAMIAPNNIRVLLELPSGV